MADRKYPGPGVYVDEVPVLAPKARPVGGFPAIVDHVDDLAYFQNKITAALGIPEEILTKHTSEAASKAAADAEMAMMTGRTMRGAKKMSPPSDAKGLLQFKDEKGRNITCILIKDFKQGEGHFLISGEAMGLPGWIWAKKDYRDSRALVGHNRTLGFWDFSGHACYAVPMGVKPKHRLGQRVKLADHVESDEFKEAKIDMDQWMEIRMVQVIGDRFKYIMKAKREEGEPVIIGMFSEDLTILRKGKRGRRPRQPLISPKKIEPGRPIERPSDGLIAEYRQMQSDALLEKSKWYEITRVPLYGEGGWVPCYESQWSRQKITLDRAMGRKGVLVDVVDVDHRGFSGVELIFDADHDPREKIRVRVPFFVIQRCSPPASTHVPEKYKGMIPNPIDGHWRWL